MGARERTVGLSPWQWVAIRRGGTAVLLALSGEREIPGGMDSPEWPLGLQRYTMALELYWQVELAGRVPQATLAEAARRSPWARDLAAALSAESPGEGGCEEVAEHLERIGAGLRGDRSMEGVAGLSLAIASIIRSRRREEEGWEGARA